MITKIKESTEEYSQDVAYRMLSILNTSNRVENVQIIYQKDLITDYIAKAMKIEVQKVCNFNYEKNRAKGGAPPIFLLLLYRGYDMLTPFMQYNTYSGMFYDMLEKTDNMMDYQISMENGENIDSRCQLNEDDNIWQTFKFK